VKKLREKKMRKNGSSRNLFEFKLDSWEGTLSLKGRGSGKSFSGQVCEQLRIPKILRLHGYKEALPSVDVRTKKAPTAAAWNARLSRRSSRM
jgi:hypothetical protein